MPNSRLLAATVAILGVALIVVGVIYFIEPAHGLPSFFPGHDARSTHHHVKHGVAAFLLGLVALAFAWFRSAPPRQRA